MKAILGPLSHKLSYWRSRLWTRHDFLHLHAISGSALVLVDAWWQLRSVIQAWRGIAISTTPHWALPVLVYLGMATCGTALLPRLLRVSGKAAHGLKHAAGQGMLFFFMAWWALGPPYFPAVFGDMGLDRVAAVLFIAIVLWYSVDTEVLLVQDRAMSTKKWSREGVDAAKVQVELNAMNANYRFGHVQLLYIPILLCIALEGRGWRPRVAARWPLEPSLFASFNANMGAAYCAAIFLRTLQLRGLASWRAMWLGSNVPVACALLAVLADRCAAGAGVTRGLDEVADAYAAPFANCGGGGGGSGGSVVGL